MDGDEGWVAMQDEGAWRKFNLFHVYFQNIRGSVRVKSNVSVSVDIRRTGTESHEASGGVLYAYVGT